MTGLNLAGTSSLALNTNPAAELMTASPTKQGLLGLTGCLSLPCTGAHPQTVPSGIRVISAGKPVKNDPRTSFSTISDIGMSSSSTQSPLPNVKITDQPFVSASTISHRLPGSVGRMFMSPGQQLGNAGPSARPSHIQQLVVRTGLGQQHAFISPQSTADDGNSYLVPAPYKDFSTLRRQSAPAAHIDPAISSAQHGAESTVIAPSDAMGSPTTLCLQRHHSHVGLPNLAGGSTSPQPFQVAGVIQPPVQHLAPPINMPHHVTAKSQTHHTTSYSPTHTVVGIGTADYRPYMGTPPQSAADCKGTFDVPVTRAVVAGMFQAGTVQTQTRAPVTVQTQFTAAISEQQLCPHFVQADVISQKV